LIDIYQFGPSADNKQSGWMLPSVDTTLAGIEARHRQESH
jgi:hypothetical protein